MTAQLNAYLNFSATTRAAMEFYHSVFGGDLTVSTFGDYQAEVQPDEVDLVMHSQLTAPAFTLMAADVPSHMGYTPGENNFSLSFSGGADDSAEITGYFDKLAVGGTVTQPRTAAPWGDTFGMLVDKFGVSWLFNIAGAAAA